MGTVAAGALPYAPQSGAVGVYVHYPFCSAICNYCNFNRGLFDEGLAARYVAALRAEIACAADGAVVDTVYFGGGTPSLMAATDVARVIAACRDAFTLDAAAEVTIEMNPESAEPATLAALREAGVNRLSLGVQSFHDEELRRLGRIHSAARARRAIQDARAAGFGNVSLDLMMWLPGQDLSAWLSNVEALVDAGPEHASLYLLEIYPNAPLRDEMARQAWHTAPDDVAADMYLLGLERLEAAGFAQYEISNVARDARYARHNLKYWTGGEWFGFGCGAHGTRQGARWRNVASTTDYLDLVALGRAPRAETRVLSQGDLLVEALIMGLRLAGGVDVVALGALVGCDIEARFGADLRPFVDASLVDLAEGRWRLTRRGMLLANEVLAVFV